MTARTTNRFDVDRLRHELGATGRTVWLAGMGAVAEVEKESRQIFDRLVEKGRRVETRQFKAIDRTVARTSERVSELSERLQCRIESGTRGLLERLGLPTRDDLEKLSGRISTLSKSVERIAAERR
jgi:poly(hydroxyalkanoate) granule-associated protein